MKAITTLLLSLSMFTFWSQDNLKHEIGLSASWRGEVNRIEAASCGSLDYDLLLHHFKFGVVLGAERWYNRDISIQYASERMKPSFTGKFEVWVGCQTNLFQSGFFISVNVAARIYFLNQIRDSISLDNAYDFHLDSRSREHIQNLPAYYPGTMEPRRGLFSYVTAMPFAILTRFDLGYDFEKFKIRAFFMPYWVRFHYENAVDPSITGKTFNFLYDLGLGVSYTLPGKKKE